MRSRNFWSRWAAPGRKLRRFYRQISEVEETSSRRSPARARLYASIADTQAAGFTCLGCTRYIRRIVILRKQRRLSDELACVSTTKTSFAQLPAFIPASLTDSMLFLTNLWLHNFPLNVETRLNALLLDRARDNAITRRKIVWVERCGS